MLQASGVEVARQLYSKAEQLLIWVTRLTKLIIGEITAIWNSFGLNPFITCQIHRTYIGSENNTNIFCDPGDRGEREPGQVGCSQHSGGGNCLSGDILAP